MTKKYAKEMLDLWKNDTNYFDGSMSVWDFESMLKFRFRFGTAETITILAALVMAGAKFKD